MTQEEKDQLEQELAQLIKITEGYTDKDGNTVAARELTEEEEERLDIIMADIDAAEAEAERSIKMEKAKRLAQRSAAAAAGPSSPNPLRSRGSSAGPLSRSAKQTPEQKLASRYSVRRAMLAKAAGTPLKGAEAEMQQQLREDAKRSGILVNPNAILVDPTFVQRSYLTSQATEGGNLVTTDELPMRDGYESYKFLRQLGVKVHDNLVGRASFPVGDMDAVAKFKAEGASADETKPGNRKPTLQPRKITAYIQPSLETLESTTYDADTRFIRALQEAKEKLLNQVAVAGGGTGEPTGIMAHADTIDRSALIAGADGGALTREMLIDLMNSPANDDADFDEMGAFLTTPRVRQQLQNLKTDAGSGIFTWAHDQPNQLLGHPAYASTLMPSDGAKGAASDLHSILFGQFGQMDLAEWAFMSILVNPYSRDIQGEVRYTLNCFADVAVSNPKAFAYINTVAV